MTNQKREAEREKTTTVPTEARRSNERDTCTGRTYILQSSRSVRPIALQLRYSAGAQRGSTHSHSGKTLVTVTLPVPRLLRVALNLRQWKIVEQELGPFPRVLLLIAVFDFLALSVSMFATNRSVNTKLFFNIVKNCENIVLYCRLESNLDSCRYNSVALM